MGPLSIYVLLFLPPMIMGRYCFQSCLSVCLKKREEICMEFKEFQPILSPLNGTRQLLVGGHAFNLNVLVSSQIAIAKLGLNTLIDNSVK